MPRRKNRKPGAKFGKSKYQSQPQDAKAGWIDRDDVQMQNERFERYYKAQRIIPEEEEWEDFVKALRRPLPSTFRIAGNRKTAQDLNDAMTRNYVPQLQNATFEGEPLPVPTPIPWYPEGLAWQINMARKELRKSQEYKKFHNFLVYETDVGNISRQEAVSMLPPLFLDVHPHHKVIDMCAAPGSKTSQLIEAFLVNENEAPSGLLVANDTDLKRTHLLIHQSSRLPCPALMVTNLDASIYPAIKIPSVGTPTEGVKPRKDKMQQIQFDRILCDVPCSGDGTIRKNLGIWKTWHALDGNGLHGLQVRILQRAMRMLRDDGRIVYSTCSLNPVENEAVVSAALNSVPGFEIVDVVDKLPELIRRPGMSAWFPSTERDGSTNYDTYEQFMTSLKSDEARASTKMSPTHWPPANANELNLARCLRIYPHLQDSGGFFVAVLQKSSHSVATASTDNSMVSAADTKRGASDALESSLPKKAKLLSDDEILKNLPAAESSEVGVQDAQSVSGKSSETVVPATVFKEQPYHFVSPTEPALQSCIVNLGLAPTFPASNLFMRNAPSEPVRSLYLVNDLLKTIIQNTDYTRIRLVSAGVKVFGKAEGLRDPTGAAVPTLRVLSEGLGTVLPYIQQDKLVVGQIPDLRTCLATYHPLCSTFAEPFQTVLGQKSLGSHIVCFKAGKADRVTLSHDLFLPLWKSGVSISLMLDKSAKSALSLRLFGEDITEAARKTAQEKGDQPLVMDDQDQSMEAADEVQQD